MRSILYDQPNLNITNKKITLKNGLEQLDKIQIDIIKLNKEQQKIIDESGVENYIIIDDDSDMLYNQRNHFVHVLPSPRNYDGFNTHYYEKAKLMLEKSVIELNYNDTVDNIKTL